MLDRNTLAPADLDLGRLQGSSPAFVDTEMCGGTPSIGCCRRRTPAWVEHPAASQTIRRLLATSDGSRGELMTALARACTLAAFTTALHRSPPTTPEDWNALGRAKLVDPELIHLALSLLARTPGAVLYLARLPEPPAAFLPRMLAAASPEWTMGVLDDLAMQHHADSAALLPLASLSVRRGGAGFSYGLAWTSASKLGRSLLGPAR